MQGWNPWPGSGAGAPSGAFKLRFAIHVPKASAQRFSSSKCYVAERLIQIPAICCARWNAQRKDQLTPAEWGLAEQLKTLPGTSYGARNLLEGKSPPPGTEADA